MNHGKVPHTCKPNGGWKRAGRPGKVQHALMCASTVLIFQQTVNCWLGNHHIIWASWFGLPLPSTVMSGRIKTSGTFFKGNQFRKAHWKYIKCLITLHLLGSDKMTEEQILNKTYFGVSQTPLFTHGPLFEAGVQKHRRFVKAKGSSGCLRPTDTAVLQPEEGHRPHRGATRQRSLKRGRCQQRHLLAHLGVMTSALILSSPTDLWQESHHRASLISSSNALKLCTHSRIPTYLFIQWKGSSRKIIHSIIKDKTVMKMSITMLLKNNS